MAVDQVFNGAVETGLRSVAILGQCYPARISLQRLVVYDYLTVHSDDIEGGPLGLHPQTPHRGAELLVRRDVLREGLMLYQSRGLVERHFDRTGLNYAGTSRTGSFLDSFRASYVEALRDRADWVSTNFAELDDIALYSFIEDRIGQWGAEFELASVLWTEEQP